MEPFFDERWKGTGLHCTERKGISEWKTIIKKKKQNEKQQTTINCDKLTKNKFTTTIQYLELYNLYHVKVSVVVAN